MHMFPVVMLTVIIVFDVEDGSNIIKHLDKMFKQRCYKSIRVGVCTSNDIITSTCTVASILILVMQCMVHSLLYTGYTNIGYWPYV